MLERLQAEMRALIDRRNAAQADLDEVIATADAEERSTFTDDETAAVVAAREAIAEVDAEIADLEPRIAELEADAERRTAAAALTERYGAPDTRPGTPDVRVGEEERTYRPDLDHQFVSDAYRAQFMGDPEAAARVTRARAEAMHEYRAVGTSAFGALVVPQYLTDMFAPVARAGRPFANSVNRLPLPDKGMTLNVPRGTTGTTVATQTENAAVEETNFDETTLAVSVVTKAGQQDVSRQALDRGEMVDRIIFADLASAYATTLDADYIAAAQAQSGIISVTYTDASPTVPEFLVKVADAIQQVNSNRYLPPTAVWMHPRRWGWLTAAVDGQNRPLVAIHAPQNAVGVGEAAAYGQVVGQIMGLPVITDANIATDQGAGTEDSVLVGRAADLLLWERGDGAPLELRFEQSNNGTGGATLTVNLVAFNYSAFTAGRYPSALAKITGTGLIAPTF